MARDVPATLSEILSIAPLGDVYAYAPEIGAHLRAAMPGAWERFRDDDARWRPEQAQGLAFLRWLEEAASESWHPHAVRVIEAVPHFRQELTNTLVFEQAPAAALVPLTTAPRDDCAGVRLYAPRACRLHAPDLERGLMQVPDALPGAHERESAPAAAGWIEAVHPGALRQIEAFAAAGGGWWDPETPTDIATPVALLAASGALVAGTMEALARPRVLSVCAIRPGSHHAGPFRPMGTCLVNHLAVAAHHAIAALGLERVAIVDWDLHHGNGTEAIFAADPRVCTISIHQHPAYPGTGAPDRDGALANHNIPLAPGDGSRAFAEAWAIAERALFAHAPQLVLVEASSDAHWADPAGDLALTEDDFAMAAGSLAQWCKGHGAALVFEVGAGLHPEAFARSLNAACASAQRVLARG